MRVTGKQKKEDELVVCVVMRQFRHLFGFGHSCGIRVAFTGGRAIIQKFVHN